MGTGEGGEKWVPGPAGKSQRPHGRSRRPVVEIWEVRSRLYRRSFFLQPQIHFSAFSGPRAETFEFSRDRSKLERRAASLRHLIGLFVIKTKIFLSFLKLSSFFFDPYVCAPTGVRNVRSLVRTSRR